jgi:type I restriction enzyme R subunit
MAESQAYTESDVEEAALDWFAELGYEVRNGNEIAPDGPEPERQSYDEPLLPGRLEEALVRLNPDLPREAIDEAFLRLTRIDSPSPIEQNRAAHRFLVDGVKVECRNPDGSFFHPVVRVIDYDSPEQNDWLAVNQYSLKEKDLRRPDTVIFVNGLPLAVFEFKNAADENATIEKAFNQLETYKDRIPSLFTYNALNIISDGLQARIGSLSADWGRYQPWRTINGDAVASKAIPELEVLIRGAFDRARFLRYLRSFIVFEEQRNGVIKKAAGYHQFHAVEAAIAATVDASQPGGDRRCGVVWHTQGAGKSLSMVFYAGLLAVTPAMENPTIVVVTDETNLDDQLFETFEGCAELLRQRPEQAESRDDLRERLRVASGHIIFTTIQKFSLHRDEEQYPLLSDRRNIVVISDEAHRSQYGFDAKFDRKTGQLRYGYAKYLRDALPNASFLGFTGTPTEAEDRSTREVFGDYIGLVYDMVQANEDGATVPIYYECRQAKLALDRDETPHLDADFEYLTETMEEDAQQRLKTKWAALEAVVGAEKRVRLIADDLDRHWAERREVLDGKAMIVCMSRRICVDLYNALVALHPEWHSDDDTTGAIKVVMTGSAADDAKLQPHVRNKERREVLRHRFQEPTDPFRIVIVRDMWLTGFDAPCLHTMYIDKPVQKHGLMQTIARVNRVWKDKPSGLIVDYLGLVENLREALAIYTQQRGDGSRTSVLDLEAAVDLLRRYYEVCCDLFFGFDWSRWSTGTPGERLTLFPAALEHVLAQTDGRKRLIQAVGLLSRAYAIARTTEFGEEIRDDVAFFQAIRAALVKTEVVGDGRPAPGQIDHAVRQLIAGVVAPEGIVDILDQAGMERPDLSILSDEFLAEIQGIPQKNLAVALLERLLKEQIRVRFGKNVVQSRRFSEMLGETMKKYEVRAVSTAMAMKALVDMAKDLREAAQKGQELGLTEAEQAFYDALGANESAVQELGDEELKAIAREIVVKIRKDITIDWAVKESVRAKMRATVKRILRLHGYPPDRQEQATETVLEQAQVVCRELAEIDRM